MEGLPEGTHQFAASRAQRVRLIVIGVIVGAYLAFRLVQGVLWLSGHL